MKTVALVLAAGASLAACTSTGRMELVEQDGYARGALGVAAIDRGDWATAEQALLKSDDSDPARLINLGRVYMETGRPTQAVHVWRLAAASKRHSDVATGDGRMVSSKQLAEALLRRHDTGQLSARAD